MSTLTSGLPGGLAAPVPAERDCPTGCEPPMTRHEDSAGPFWRCSECLVEWDEADLDPLPTGISAPVY